MSFPQKKLSTEMKAYIIDEALKGTATGKIKAGLIEEFGLSEDFISTSRISVIRSKARKDRKKARKTLSDSKPMTTEQLEEMEEDAVIVKDLKTILSNVIIKPKSKIESIYYAYENAPEPDVWTLLDILSINSVSPSAQRRVVLNFFGLDTVKEVWPSSKHTTLKKKVIDDPTSGIDRLVKKRIKALEGKIALEELQETWAHIKGKTDDPVANLKRQLEFQTLLTQLENVNKNDAMGMMKEYRIMMKEDKSGDGSFLNNIKGLKELGVLGDNQKPEEAALVKILERQLDKSESQSTEYRQLVENIRDSTSKERTDALEQKMQLQIAMIQKDQMTSEDWENLLLRRRTWAKEEGYVHKKDIDSDLNKGEQALKRIENVGDRIDKLPDKLTGVFEKAIDKTISSFDKLSQVQERRRLQVERRNHLMQAQLSRSGGIPPSPATQNVDDFLDDLEDKIDNQAEWQKLNERGEDLEIS